MRWKSRAQYRLGKDKAREEAFLWQLSLSKQEPSLECLARQQARFRKLALKYGLTKEFRENGII